MIRVGINGALGKMGRAIAYAISSDDRFSLGAAIDAPTAPYQGDDYGELVGVGRAGVALGSDVNGVINAADVFIDFSDARIVSELADRCRAHRKPLVVGTTALDANAQTSLARLATVAPVVVAPNMSVGVNVLFHIANEVARLVGHDFDVEIVEMHHRHKKDSPSGTAMRLYDSIAAARQKSHPVTGREGTTLSRTRDEIGVLALRGGDVVGDHTAIFAGPGERIELTHRAHSREVFARGALRAAAWVVTEKPGLYSMTDVLGLI